MSENQIVLDFGEIVLEATLFDTQIATKFAENLPYVINLQGWGNELYGPVEDDLGAENPVPMIPAGGIAYSTQGNYVCIFFGQTPAWPVEYIGQIKGDTWKKLIENPLMISVTIRKGII